MAFSFHFGNLAFTHYYANRFKLTSQSQIKKVFAQENRISIADVAPLTNLITTHITFQNYLTSDHVWAKLPLFSFQAFQNTAVCTMKSILLGVFILYFENPIENCHIPVVPGVQQP